MSNNNTVILATSKEVGNKFLLYRNLIDPSDKMQLDNLKWVNSFITHSKRAIDNWEEYCLDFLDGAIQSQKDLLTNIDKFRM